METTGTDVDTGNCPMEPLQVTAADLPKDAGGRRRLRRRLRFIRTCIAAWIRDTMLNSAPPNFRAMLPPPGSSTLRSLPRAVFWTNAAGNRKMLAPTGTKSGSVFH